MMRGPGRSASHFDFLWGYSWGFSEGFLWLTRLGLFCAVVLLAHVHAACAQQTAGPATGAFQKPALSVDEIVSRLQEKNHEREMALRKFQCTRVYSVKYQGILGTREAEAVVTFNYASPGDREFTVVSETGSKFILEHVIKGLLEGEKESGTEENRKRTAMNASNYNFTLDEDETAREATQYVLNVSPKNDNKFLYRGKIWVDARDFALTRIDAEPAKSPSFWVKRSDVHHRYEKVDDFWLPAENKTESWIRLGGHALLSIEYKQYKITEATALEQEPDAHADSASGDVSGQE
jgi:outer membrane lipoprotein-sorting protein